MKTARGELTTILVNAVSKSKYGMATSEFVLHDKYGLISWTAIPANGHIFQFNLVRHLPGSRAIASNKQFAFLNAEREQNIKATNSKRAMNYMGIGGGR